MFSFPKSSRVFLRLIAALILLTSSLAAGAKAQPSDPGAAVCPRFAAGSIVANPPELRSRQGILETTLTFKSAADAAGHVRYCYVSETGLQSPTLRVKPGDLLVIHFRNGLRSPARAAISPVASRQQGGNPDAPCHMPEMSASATNLHFHGMSIPPTCHQDDAIHTVIQPGVAFDYKIRIPQDEPPGLYWYHPHLHGFTQAQLEGGASAALIVEGAQGVYPSLTGLPERVLVIRDQPSVANAGRQALDVPAKDLSINYVPVTYPQYKPAMIQANAGERQFWRVVSAAGTTILDLQVLVNGAAQNLSVFSVDSVPIVGGPVVQDHVLLPPGARAEFVVTAPPGGKTATLVTRKWDSGPRGDSDPARPLAEIVTESAISESKLAPMPKRAWPPSLPEVKPTFERRLYFMQTGAGDDDDAGARGPDTDANTSFFIQVDAYKSASFDMHAPPVFAVHQGTVEDWIVTNASPEDHVFHIHQLHFRVLEVNGRPVNDPILRDTINVPHQQRNAPPSSVKLRMDFRGPNVVGTFIYQCHIVAHGERGMMGAIQVLPPGQKTSIVVAAPDETARLMKPLIFIAKVTPAGKDARVPEGMVQFEVDGNLDGPQVPLSGGQASRQVSFFSTGIHRIRATYYGDATHEASQAQEITVTARGLVPDHRK